MKSFHRAIWIALLFFFFGLISCSKKYKEDPLTMYFIQVQTRIKGEWKITKIEMNGADWSELLGNPRMFTNFNFEPNESTPNEGYLVAATRDNSINIKYDCLYSFEVKTFETIDLECGFFGDSLVNNKIVPTYGPINNLSTNISNWKILKLTKKEMHLSKNENGIEYGVFFKII